MSQTRSAAVSARDRLRARFHIGQRVGILGQSRRDDPFDRRRVAWRQQGRARRGEQIEHGGPSIRRRARREQTERTVSGVAGLSGARPSRELVERHERRTTHCVYYVFSVDGANSRLTERWRRASFRGRLEASRSLTQRRKRALEDVRWGARS